MRAIAGPSMAAPRLTDAPALLGKPVIRATTRCRCTMRVLEWDLAELKSEYKWVLVVGVAARRRWWSQV